MDGKIDIHNTDNRFALNLRRLENDPAMIPENRELILKFVNDSLAGKTIKKGQKKKISKRRCVRFVQVMKLFSHWFGKPFADVEQADMERVILGLESDRFVARTGKPFTDESKVTFKKIVRKFWKWYQGDCENHPKIVSWIDTSCKIKEIPALTLQEARKLIDYAPALDKKLMIMLFFDSGCRPEELYNVRWYDLKKKDGPTGHYYMIRIRHSKTRPRTISVPLSTEFIDETLKRRPELPDSPQPIITMEYTSFQRFLRRLGETALGKRVYPYLFRHSSVTYYAGIINNRQRLCYRYGWSMSSKEVDRYIDREGFVDEETAEAVQNKEVDKFKKENEDLKRQLSSLREDVNSLLEVENSRRSADRVMNKLTGNRESLKELLEMIRKRGLQQELSML